MGYLELVAALKKAVAEGEDSESAALARSSLDAGVDPMALIREAIQPAMDEVGQSYETGDAFLPELIRAGDAAKAALDLIVPRLSDDDQAAARKGTVVIGTMYGDNHDIGKNIVSAILAANGFKVVDLRVNVPPKEFLQAAQREGATIIAASTLITTSLPYQREIVRLLADSGNRERFYVVVGGGPVTPEWARQIGADGYGRDAKDAAELCLRLIDAAHAPGQGDTLAVGALKR